MLSTVGAATTMNGRHYAPGSNPSIFPPYASQQDPNDADFFRSHIRDLSGSRGRGPAPADMNTFNMQPQSASNLRSPRSQSSVGAARSPAVPNAALERRPSASQAHHRQASKAHGYQQSRNAIFLASPTTSPLSPDTPGSAASNIGLPDLSSLSTLRRGASLRHPSEVSGSTIDGSNHMSPKSTLVEEHENGQANHSASTLKRIDRIQSSKARRGHSHHRSQSKSQQEQRSVGEYALHHLFQRVCSPCHWKKNH